MMAIAFIGKCCHAQLNIHPFFRFGISLSHHTTTIIAICIQDPGQFEHDVTCVKANQFILTLRLQRDGVCVYQKVLSCATAHSSVLSLWDFSFPPHHYHCRGLYPRPWAVFEIPEFKIRIMCRQLSPVFPYDYYVAYKSCIITVCAQHSSLCCIEEIGI
ncbi:unnamed protein product [Gongylonema pulchrum]|uniref:Glyco_hydr_116N domain-containing protein n=1 Tax=Gongylonema pulchrum TaxID=637853 RepID=A0A183ERT0_9BILA|nr:unnamed protein product [Gongylonema pulchrum]